MRKISIGTKFYFSLSLAWLVVIGGTQAQSSTNDLFVNRTVLTGTNITATGSSVDATKESGEPDHGSERGGKSLWWTWTAPDEGIVFLDTSGSSFATTLGIYAGDTITNLTPQPSQYVSADDDYSSKIKFLVKAGDVCQIAVDGFSGEGGNITLHLNLIVIPMLLFPPNDFDALVGGSAFFRISAQSVSPLRYQWQRDGTNLVESAGVSGVQSNLLSLTNLTLADANDYTVVVSNDRGSITNSAALNVFEPAANDLFANRTPVSGTNVILSGHNLGATTEAGEESYDDESGASVWWTWTAPFSGLVQINLKGDFYNNGLLAFYTGDAITNLAEVPFDYPLVSVVQGTTYQIQAFTDQSDAGTIIIDLDQILVPVIKNSPGALLALTEASVSFSVIAVSGSPLNYQWQRNGTNLADSDKISGVHSSTLRLTHLTLSDAATYVVVVSNANGSLTNQATLTIFEPVSNDFFKDRITLSGTNITVTSHTVGTTGEAGDPFGGPDDGIASVWWTWTAPFNGPVLIDFEEKPTAPYVSIYTGDALADLEDTVDLGGADGLIFIATAGATYQIEAATLYGYTGLFKMRLNYVPHPVITQISQGLSVPVGATAKLSVTAVSISPLTYQWRRNATNLNEGGNFSGVHSSQLTLMNVTFADAGRYSVVVSNDQESIESIDSFLDVLPLTKLTNGVPHVASSDAGSYFVISVPQGQKLLIVSATGSAEGIAQLGFDQNYSNFNFFRRGPITIQNPPAGDWTIYVDPFAGSSDINLLAQYYAVEPALDTPQVAGNLFTMRLSGIEGWTSMILETSTNLEQWQPIQTNSITASNLSITNVINPARPQSYFRVTVQ